MSHVFVTHLHFDHVDDLLNYKNARVYVGKKELEGATSAAPSWGHGRIMHEFSSDLSCRQRLMLVEDQEVLPGIESFWIGGHTPGSMAYLINTEHGKAVLTGDTVQLLANIEQNIPPGIFTSYEQCMTAMEKIRDRADLVLPSHDPGTLDRWPPLPRGAPRYTIRASKVGQCQVRDYITFQGS
ncbi:MAG: MBL fold metallo-hydrolase, partial [Planctomycetota bacterium]|nr:MBL fold metallo-hydrolase [Planctomycetota bacterium]